MKIRKNKRAEKKSPREPFNDCLIPIFCVLSVMPFCIYLAEYDYGYSKYLWHSDNSIAQDLYAYYRSYFFVLVSVVSLFVLVMRMVLYREKNKSAGLFFSLAVYSGTVVLSTIFSVNQRASLTGNFYQFQSVFVLLGFCLMAFYTYQIMETEKDYQRVIWGLAATFLLISIPGWCQVFQHDLLNEPWAQRLVMSEEQFAVYGGEITDLFSGNHVFLTLYNPNYAGVFLAMFAAVFGVLAYGEQERRKRYGYLLLLLASLILLWFTYTRAALLSLGAAGMGFLFCLRKSGKKSFKYILPGCILILAVWIGLDACNGFSYFSRILESPKKSSLEEIRTSKEGILITCEGESLLLKMEKGALSVTDERGGNRPLKQDAEGNDLLPFAQPVPVILLPGEEEPSCVVSIEEYALEFVKTKEGYFYRNEDGKLDQMVEIPKVDLHGLESLGSGRLYIWSRVFPMLKDYLLVGSGPDTFAEVYPQNDYVGKMLYAGTTRRIMEGAHNDYLTRWVQTGLVSLLALLVFYGWFLLKCFSYYRTCPLETRKHRLGFGCFLACIAYLVCCLFSDSTLYTTPVFYIFAGIALSAVESSGRRKGDKNIKK